MLMYLLRSFSPINGYRTRYGHITSHSGQHTGPRSRTLGLPQRQALASVTIAMRISASIASLGPLLDVIVHKLQELKHGCYLVSKSGIVNAMSSWSLLTIVPPYRDTHRPLPEPELLQLLIRICHCQVIGIGSRHRYWVETWAVTLLGIRQLLGDQILQVFQTLVDGCLVSADGK
jgi:hypothetical protein